jgi:DEAD/DEAH box helicase domain-containing protein
MWPFFEKADLLVTYNGEHFDIPLLQKYTDKIDLWKIKHIDIFKEIREVTGKKLGLDGVAGTTLNISKSANGLQAVAWWNSGEIDKIIKYCEQDVKVTKDLYDYAFQNSKIFYIDRNSGEKIEVKLNTKNWEKIEGENSLFGGSENSEPQQMGLF